MFFAAAASTVIILVILAGLKPLEEAYRARIQSCNIVLLAERGTLSLDGLPKQLGVRATQVKRILIQDEDGETQRVEIQLARVSTRDIRLVTERMKQLLGVREVKVSRRKSASES